MNKNIPAISIVIPVYNMEKYIGECLASILAQTFTDYEVIAVDDCSTDRTCAIVEKYIPKFNGRLKLIRSKVNSGGAGVPRNKGIGMSVGKWLFLMDADDVITETAMAELYEIAETYNVDLLHCERMYSAIGDTDEIPANKAALEIRTGEIGTAEFVTKPTFMPDDLSERIEIYTKGKFWNAPWSQFYRRDFIALHNIKFPTIKIADDVVFNFKAVCLANHIVRIPNVYYVWRKNPISNVRAVLPTEKRIYRIAGSIFQAISLLDEFIDTLPDSEKHTQYKYSAFDLITRVHIGPILDLYNNLSHYELDELIRPELDKVEDKTALTAFIFAQMCSLKASLFSNLNLIRIISSKKDDLIKKLQADVQDYQEQIQNQAVQIKILQRQLKK